MPSRWKFQRDRLKPKKRKKRKASAIRLKPKKQKASAIERFWRRVQIGSGDACSLWTGKPDANGYGAVWIDGRLWKVHRFAWTLANGPIPRGQMVRHRCPGGPNRLCVKHLAIGTHEDNSADTVADGRAGRPWKLSEEQRRDLQQRHASGETRASLAARFGVSKNTATRVAKGVLRGKRTAYLV